MLYSERLTFRQFTYDDFQDLREILANEKVCQYLPGEGKKSDEEINKWLQFFVRSFNDELGNKIFAITLKNQDKVIGYGGIGFVREFDELEIMYGFNELYWRKGYASETSLRMKDYAKELNIEEVIALADVGNVGSQKILLKTGFKEIEEIELWGLKLYFYRMKL